MKQRGFLFDSPVQLRAIVSPVRQEIIDVVISAGPSSMADIGRYLGRPADGLYFHVRALRKVGLLIEREPRRDGRHVAAVYDVPGRPFRIRMATASRKLVSRVMSAAIRLGLRDLTRAFADPDATSEGLEHPIWSSRAKGWVTPVEHQRINRKLREISEILASARPGPGRRLRSFTYVWAPTPPNPRADVPDPNGES
ncbi:MAG: winged helix-turn-helix domain-containing protein [Phycisphaerae bacterium]